MAVDVAIACIKAVVMLLIALQVMAMGVYFERKVSAIIQDRIGANRASILGFAGQGLVNTLVADPLKFLLKEDVRPDGADPFLHTLAPLAAVIPALAAFAVVPFADVLEIGGRTINLQAASLDVGVLYILAMASLGVYGIVLAGWASNSKYSLLGGLRSAAQMVSYELAAGLAIVSVFMLSESLSLHKIVADQANGAWYVFKQPLAFVIFFICS